MSRDRRLRREITCEACGCPCLAPYKSRNICKSCWRQEPSTLCARCGHLKHQVNEETGLCPRCSAMLARPTGQCSRCNQVTLIYDEEAWLCARCRGIVHYLARSKQAKQDKITCSVCGQQRTSELIDTPICRECWLEQHNGREICVKCKRLKVIYKRDIQLCKHCYQDSLAPNAARNYITNFTTPYPFNKILLNLLASSLDWEQVNEKTYRKIRAFGCFLQNQPLPEPLTWEAIEVALPPLAATNRTTPKLIRACLYDLGHLLTAQGKLESRESFIARRYALSPLEQAPTHIQEVLRRYAAWLWERKTAPGNVRKHLEDLVAFWKWCEPRKILSPAAVQAAQVNNYLLTLYWQWQCSTCQGILPFEPRQRKAPKVCPHCRTLHSFTKVKRYAQNTIRGCRASLFVFFSWAKINQLVITNPIQRMTPAPRPTIKYYPLETLKLLCDHLFDPDADPTAALCFYLIIFHGFSVWELRHAQLPILHTIQDKKPLSVLAEAYYMIVPRQAPSLGNRTPGRPSTRLDFPPSAAKWLKPLLERFEQRRCQSLRNPNNQYLLVAPSQSRHDTPVGHVFVWGMIQRASQQLLGAACNPNTLRKSAGVLFTDQAGPGVLQSMGWGDQQAFAYLWAEREMIQLPKADRMNTEEGSLDSALIVFPSPYENMDEQAKE